MKKLPIGIQTFSEIINDGYLYIDKTEYIYNLLQTGKYFFLSRPRRFGKSLLISTLKELFLSNSALFKDLWIYKSNHNWQEYPVIMLDFSIIPHLSPLEFRTSLNNHLYHLACAYDLAIKEATPEETLTQLVKKLSEQHKVVILIDEYDKPILDYIHDVECAQRMQEILRSFFATIKDLDALYAACL